MFVKVAVIEPYYVGSHKQWAESYQRYTSHDIRVFHLSGNHWKWRMHGASITLSKQLKESGFEPDIILATDMLDVASFKSLLGGRFSSVPVALYMHENQLTYPWSNSDTDRTANRDNHYGFINYTSALVADKVFFNSNFHQNSFLKASKSLLEKFPDYRNLETIDQIMAKSEVLSLGVDLISLLNNVDGPKKQEILGCPTILWNHRWEFDKEPDLFFSTLIDLASEGLDFNLIVLGESFKKAPPIFQLAKEKLEGRILHWGYCENRNEYAALLCKSDILPVTSIHDFFGVSVVEAIYCGAIPLLPNDLAYPEHLDEHNRMNHLYEKGEFKSRLKAVILEHNSFSGFSSQKVKGYDWSIMAPLYDQKLKSLIG